ncbi:glutamine--fructose-6-phosphate transaminase (isomerizing), partial [Candidatus Gottesmanbacteria bacterium]|nr:glutamine--fructose-6-phosphate transaminase (isomerizing) [Candidatus Gottesmanbacteria bacterium]
MDGAKVVLEGLKSLEYRGYDSWGVAVVPLASRPGLERGIVVKKKTGKIGDATVNDMPPSSFAFGHTRWATHGGVTQANAHPHLDCTGTIALIHNGIFENYEKIKQSLLKKGHRFISQTDTEVAVHLIEEHRKRMLFPKAVQMAFNEMEGLNAIIAMDTKDGRLVAARNGSPLVVGFGDGENFLASDAVAILPYTKQVYFLEDGEMAIIGSDDMRIFDAQSGRHIIPKVQKLAWSVEQVDKGQYPNYMLKEIHEQPAIVAEIASSGGSRAEKLSSLIRGSYGTYMVGCGTAAHAALVGQYLFAKIARRHVNWAIGSEFGYHLDFLTKKSVVLALSQSGETIDILESIKKAKDRGAKIAALVNVLGSSLYRAAHERVMIGAGPEKSVASTKAFTGMLAHLILVVHALAGIPKEGQKMVAKAATITKRLLAPTSLKKMEKLARKLKESAHMYVIGRGLSYPASLETALKIKEISYIHAEGMAAGELKHGPLALVTKGTPVIAFLPNDETYGANLAGAMEMKARGAYVIGVSYKPHEVF